MKLTVQKIEELKALHGTKVLFVLESEDGKKAICKDAFSSLPIAKNLFVAIGKSAQEFAEAFINNLMVEGDPEFKTDPSLATGLADEMKDLLDMPEFSYKREGNLIHISSEGETVAIRPIDRNDLVVADRKDKTKEPFAAASFLLEQVAVEKEWKQLQVRNCRAFVGILLALDELKEKKTVTVQKF